MTEALGPILNASVERLTYEVLNRACMAGLKLATAESCTGGLLASLLTDVPGCSHAFERGFVVYTEEAKAELLGVPEHVLARVGPVSAEVARAMADGAIARSHAGIALAVTGWTEGGPGQPAGTVWFGCARRGRATATRLRQWGEMGRAGIRLAALETGLEMMIEALNA